MCGIAGIVSLNGSAAIDPGIVRRMADAMFHRGPDEDGYFFRSGLAMANRRLSIVGLADGRQPMHNEDRSVSVVFNGELFDYPEVRTELIAKGHRFRTHCDTELIPHLWEEDGERMLERLRGQFAIALWDERRRLLVLARDRFGICPLYWTRQKLATGEVLLFASKVVVNDLKENTFYAVIHMTVRGERMAIDARPSDAIAMALGTGAPIRVASTTSSPSSPCRDRSPALPASAACCPVGI